MHSNGATQLLSAYTVSRIPLKDGSVVPQPTAQRWPSHAVGGARPLILSGGCIWWLGLTDETREHPARRARMLLPIPYETGYPASRGPPPFRMVCVSLKGGTQPGNTKNPENQKHASPKRSGTTIGGAEPRGRTPS